MSAVQAETALVRDNLDDVVRELRPSVELEHDGYLLPRPVVVALIALVGDLRDMHDETAIDVENWPTLADFCESMLLEHDLDRADGGGVAVVAPPAEVQVMTHTTCHCTGHRITACGRDVVDQPTDTALTQPCAECAEAWPAGWTCPRACGCKECWSA